MRRFKPPHPCAFPAVLNAAWAATGYGLGGLPAIVTILIGGVPHAITLTIGGVETALTITV